MKRMYRFTLLFFIAAAIPVAAVSGQEKKNEQKIKVVINDGSGEKTVLDTTYTGETTPQKINLKNGKVIFIGEPGEKMTHVTSDGKGKKVFVTVSSDGDGKKEIEKKVIIMSGDSMVWTAKPDEKTIAYRVETIDNDNDTNVERTKYVIAKDGFVVTVEGDDEEKAKELMKVIESKLGVKEEGNVKKEVVKEETKKSVKK